MNKAAVAQPPEAMCAGAIELMQAGRLIDAVTMLEQLRTNWPAEIAGYALGSEALWRLSRHTEAETLSAAAMALFPDSLWVAHVHAQAAMQRSDAAEAAKRWAAVRHRFPTDPGGYANGASALIKLNQLDEAAPLLEWLVHHHPELPDGWIGNGTLAMRSADWPVAERLWQTVRKRFPDMAVGYGCGIEALARLGRAEDADALGEAAVARFPDNLWLAHLAAGLPTQRQDLAAAADRWAYVRQTFPNDPFGYEQGARILHGAGRTAEAQALLFLAALRFPDRSEAFSALAELAAERDAWAEAAVHWAEVRRRSPNLVNGYVQGVTALKRAGLGEAANELAAEGDQRFETSLELVLVKLEASLDAGLMPEIWELWRRCRRLGGRATPHFYTLSWRVYLLEYENPRAVEIRDTLLAEPVLPDPEAVPALLRGLAWCLQLRDERFAGLHRAVTGAGNAADDVPLPAVLQAVLGLLSPDALAELIRQRLSEPPSKLTRVLFSSFEEHQAAAVGVWSGTGAALRAALPALSVTAAPTAFLAFNLLFYAFSQGAASFPAVAVALGPVARRVLGGPCDAPNVWTAVDTICRARTAPPVPRGLRRGNRLRIVLCVSGQLRGFRRARQTWNLLGLERHELTTVVHVWRNIGRQEMALANEQRGFPRAFVEKYNRLVFKVGLQTLKARFPSFYAVFTARSEVSEAELREVYGTNHVVVEDDGDEPFTAMTNPMKMYRKVQAAHDLARSLEGGFDLFVRLRPDKEVVACNGVDWEQVCERSCQERMVFCDYGTVITPVGDLIFGDQFAAGCGEVMDVYARTWSDATSDLSRQFGYERSFAGHVNFVSNLLFHGVTAAGVPQVQFGGLLDPAGLSMSRLRELAKEDAAKEPDDEVARLFLDVFAGT